VELEQGRQSLLKKLEQVKRYEDLFPGKLDFWELLALGRYVATKGKWE
jgi:hypothetical protein